MGTKAVNALSGYFKIESVRDGQMKRAEFDRGVLRKDEKLVKTDEPNGTRVVFEPDDRDVQELPVPGTAHRATHSGTTAI